MLALMGKALAFSDSPYSVFKEQRTLNQYWYQSRSVSVSSDTKLWVSVLVSRLKKPDQCILEFWFLMNFFGRCFRFVDMIYVKSQFAVDFCCFSWIFVVVVVWIIISLSKHFSPNNFLYPVSFFNLYLSLSFSILAHYEQTHQSVGEVSASELLTYLWLKLFMWAC